MVEVNLIQKFRSKNLRETRNYYVQEIEENDLLNKKPKMLWMTLNYIGHFLNLTSTIAGYISISAFGSLVSVPVGITSSAIELNICALTAWIKKYKSISRKRRKIMIK